MPNIIGPGRAMPAALCALTMGLFPFHAPVRAADAAAGAIAGGDMKLDLRFRIESVEEDNARRDATASTLRTRLGYLTDEVAGASVYLEMEDIAGAFDEDYDSGSNGRTSYSKVVDPDLTEVNQAYLRYEGLQETTLTMGRQRIILDNARFVGNVGWRQNEQTYDALAVENAALPETTLTYAYVTNVNTITGANTDTETHILNADYDGLAIGRIVPYAYLLDTGESTADSQTTGLRLTGGVGVSDLVRLLYTAEFARQGDYADAPATVDADYTFAELGLEIEGLTFRLGSETLGGDGVYAFQTPLATKHAFNGWADKFLATPVDGLSDTMFSVSTGLRGARLMAVYHDFSADNGAAEYGTEIDLLAVKKFGPHYTLGLKYAGYDADAHSVDTDKLWAWARAAF